MSKHGWFRRMAVGSLAIAAASFATTIASAMELATPSAASYTSEGANISGWTWLRAKGNYAEWTWKAGPAGSGPACLNFTVLTTNTASGGSGHNGKLKMQLTKPDGGRISPATISFVNPFRPKVNFDTRGVGYMAYGTVCPGGLGGLVESGFRLRVEWSGGAHVAVRKDSATLAIVR